MSEDNVTESSYEIREGKPFLGGKEIVLLFTQDQKTLASSIDGYNLGEEIRECNHATVDLIKFWQENPRFFPENFKYDKYGNYRLLHFWQNHFNNSVAISPKVPYVSWASGRVVSSSTQLDHRFSFRYPAVVLKA